MEFEKLITERYSVRAYTREEVPEEDLQAVLEAARLAPTAANRQPFKLIVIHTAGREEELKRIYGAPWFVQAPVVICACGIPGKGWARKEKNYTDVDVAIVMDHLILAAANRGLGTCWVGAFDPAAAREVLELPEELEPIAFTPLGWPADQPGEKARKAIGELVEYDR